MQNIEINTDHIITAFTLLWSLRTDNQLGREFFAE
jgi:hypothetical protein